jgi:hypothetical protein
MPSRKSVVAAAAAPGFTVHERLQRELAASRQLQRGEPTHRRLRIFTSDPTASRLAGRTAVAEVPYEPLTLEDASRRRTNYQCLCSALFELHMIDHEDRALALPLLDEPQQLMQDGYAPSESNPRFHAQMVYAVASRVHADFRRALGREPGWGFAGAHKRLKVYPLGSRDENAWYDPARGELMFGYFPRAASGWASTALMHDIVAHELTHALLDSQRPHFMEPTGPDVWGFHEGFADLMALFQHFQYREPLRAALRESRGVIFAREKGDKPAHWLCRIARQFGAADGLDALRRADRKAGTNREAGELLYDDKLEEHDMGELLLSAVFDAFDTVYRRRTRRLLCLATGGSGVLPPGDLHPDLLDALADEAAAVAQRFMAVTVRALDYCPPASIELGEYLRAMVTADAVLMPDDHFGLREALIDAFRERRIFPRYVFSLTEDSLLWGQPQKQLQPLTELSFAATRFDGGPGRPLAPENRRRQAEALGRWLLQPEAMVEAGLVFADDARLAEHGARVSLPSVDALEVTSSASADGEMHFHTVAVVTQRVTVAPKGKVAGFEFQAGGTLLFDPEGRLRMAISKSALGKDRIQRRRDFLDETGKIAPARGNSTDGAEVSRWILRDGMRVLREGWQREFHRQQRQPSPTANASSAAD